MKRDPSLHIKLSTLIEILDHIMPEGVDIKGIAKLILITARPYSMGNRILMISTDQIQKKCNSIVKSSQNDAGLMAKTILMIRRQLKHVGIRLIEPTSKDWTIVKTITEMANQFCGEFEVKKSDGYKLFISIGVAKMSKFNLPKLTAMYESICETYAAMREIEADPTPSETEQAHAYYRIKVAEKTGIVNTYKNMPDKYVYFVKLKALAKSLNISYKEYIDSQFAMMEYRGALPDPYQLVGDKAKARLNKYLYQKR